MIYFLEVDKHTELCMWNCESHFSQVQVQSMHNVLIFDVRTWWTECISWLQGLDDNIQLNFNERFQIQCQKLVVLV